MAATITDGTDTCHECGGPCRTNGDGTTNHLDEDGGIDHDADADHVALPENDFPQL